MYITKKLRRRKEDLELRQAFASYGSGRIKSHIKDRINQQARGLNQIILNRQTDGEYLENEKDY